MVYHAQGAAPPSLVNLHRMYGNRATLTCVEIVEKSNKSLPMLCGTEQSLDRQIRASVNRLRIKVPPPKKNTEPPRKAFARVPHVLYDFLNNCSKHCLATWSSINVYRHQQKSIKSRMLQNIERDTRKCKEDKKYQIFFRKCFSSEAR